MVIRERSQSNNSSSLSKIAELAAIFFRKSQCLFEVGPSRLHYTFLLGPARIRSFYRPTSLCPAPSPCTGRAVSNGLLQCGWITAFTGVKQERIYVNKQQRPEKFLVAFSGKVFWLEFWSFESSVQIFWEFIHGWYSVHFREIGRYCWYPKACPGFFTFSLFLEI